ncbi:MAG TPA: aspartate ammonia-lyase [Nitrososphaeraceae archaeon]|nr:aspartate ammonia-lyase [Nitrososphaeraceae archaeon]
MVDGFIRSTLVFVFMESYRLDKDSLGEVRVPSNAYYGPFSVRASNQYKVTGQKPHVNMINAFAMIKRSAALANRDLKTLPVEKSDAIVKACDDILSGKLHDQIIVDTINSGAGTAFNMNMNEVIANRAIEISGRSIGDYSFISPNDDVNMSQSSNDTFPTAMHVALLTNMKEVMDSLNSLITSLEKKAQEFREVIKIGRTHLMDAIPVTLGSEFDVYALSLKRGLSKIKDVCSDLEYVGLGGTAVGTGANTPPGYDKLVVKYLSQISELNLKPSENYYFSLQSKFETTMCSSTLRNIAIELIKMSNDIRMMASGPIAGLSEISIPAVHAGSSIMPGKVNPSLSECLNMICFIIVGNDLSVAMAAQAGQFELNVMLPGMIKNILESTDMLKNFLPIYSQNMIDGLKANEQKLASLVEKSPILVTLLNPHIGYLKASEIYKESMVTNKSIRELILEKGLMTKEELDNALSKKNILGSK